MVGRLQERRDVGAAEPVDRLLRVADEEQAPRFRVDLVPRSFAGARIARAEQRGELDLNRIGVLELVDEDALVAVTQPRPGARTMARVAQQGAREYEQVVELELAGRPSLGDRGLG